MSVRRYHHEGGCRRTRYGDMGHSLVPKGCSAPSTRPVFRRGGQRRPRGAVAIGQFAPVAAGLRIRRRFPTQCGSTIGRTLAGRIVKWQRDSTVSEDSRLIFGTARGGTRSDAFMRHWKYRRHGDQRASLSPHHERPVLKSRISWCYMNRNQAPRSLGGHIRTRCCALLEPADRGFPAEPHSPVR